MSQVSPFISELPSENKTDIAIEMEPLIKDTVTLTATLTERLFYILSKALHSELLTELSSRVSSRNEFSRVGTGRVQRHFFVIFGNFGKWQFPKLAKTKSSVKARKTRPDSKKVWKFRIGTIFRSILDSI